MKTTIRYSHCVIFGTIPLVCPLCGADVPPNTRHECAKAPEPKKKAKLKGKS